jgi:hypothetical protein
MYPSFVTFANFCLVCLCLQFHSMSSLFLRSYRALAFFGKLTSGLRKASTPTTHEASSRPHVVLCTSSKLLGRAVACEGGLG